MRRYLEMVFVLIVLAIAAMATVAWGAEEPQARTLETLMAEPQTPVGDVDLLQACRQQASEAALKMRTPAEAGRVQGVTMCTCLGGLPVVLASTDWRSAGIGCARPLSE